MPSKAETLIYVDFLPVNCCNLLGVGIKATSALLSFARDKRSRDTVDGLLLEMVISPAKIKKSKIKLNAENSDLNGSTVYDSDEAVSRASTVLANTDADTAESVAEKKPKSKRTLQLSKERSSEERRKEVETESVADEEGEEEVEEVGISGSTDTLPMDGWCVVFTGKLSSQSRAEAEQLCVKLGESGGGKGREEREGRH